MSDRMMACLQAARLLRPLTSQRRWKLGSCKLIEEIMIGEDKLIHFSGVEMGEACTIILRGASEDLTNLAAQGQCLPAKVAGCFAGHVAFSVTCRMLIGFLHLTLPPCIAVLKLQ